MQLHAFEAVAAAVDHGRDQRPRHLPAGDSHLLAAGVDDYQRGLARKRRGDKDRRPGEADRARLHDLVADAGPVAESKGHLRPAGGIGHHRRLPLAAVEAAVVAPQPEDHRRATDR